MNKTELISAVAKKAGMTQAEISNDEDKSQK